MRCEVPSCPRQAADRTAPLCPPHLAKVSKRLMGDLAKAEKAARGASRADNARTMRAWNATLREVITAATKGAAK